LENRLFWKTDASRMFADVVILQADVLSFQIINHAMELKR
jgi:hypothetical protein